jgi:hypothetical protein
VVEIGIDAVPDKEGILLEWYKSNDRNIRYIDIYRQKDGETFFRKIWRIDLETASSGQDISYIDDSEDIGFNKYNYYYLKALNSDGGEGQPSDTIQYNLLQKPILSRPNGEIIDGLPVFYWNFPDVIPDSYILRIQEEFTNRLVFVDEIQVDDYFNDQDLDLANDPRIENPPQFISGFTYRWRIDSVGSGFLDPDDRTINYSGSESQWFTFIAN